MIVVGIVFLLPVFWLLITSVKPEGDIMRYPPEFIPRHLTGENFASVFRRFAFGRWAVNSVVVATAATMLVLPVDAAAGYALARLRFPGRNALYLLILSMLMVPLQVTVIPLFIGFVGVDMLNSYWALILPTVANVTGVFLLRQFFVSVPVELEDAARIDGTNQFQLWWFIMVPLARPVLATVAIITFMSSWNNFLWPLIAVSNDATRTLPIGIAQFMGASSGASGSAPTYGMPTAAAAMATAPAVVVFLALQRWFVRGITSTGIKG
ncbi:MAG TPA: carbohydrate ABC transporter permease [Candidatus Baltobacteraceae bacterium]|nr:carbohydrate ABC transporter permease [Candidatus Baltobacteraceae bacterium]